jgi:hypothetical protein
VTAKEAEQAHGISRARIRQLKRRGRIEARGKEGRADLFDLDELRAVPCDGRPRDELGRFAVAELVMSH